MHGQKNIKTEQSTSLNYRRGMSVCLSSTGNHAVYKCNYYKHLSSHSIAVQKLECSCDVKNSLPFRLPINILCDYVIFPMSGAVCPAHHTASRHIRDKTELFQHEDCDRRSLRNASVSPPVSCHTRQYRWYSPLGKGKRKVHHIAGHDGPEGSRGTVILFL